MMKKFVSVFFYIAITVLFTMPAFAADTNHCEIPDTEISINIPTNLYAFTPYIKDNDPNIYTVGITKKSILNLLGENGKMIMLPKGYDHLILISQIDSSDDDLNNLSEIELHDLGKSFVSDTSDGMTRSYEIYTNSQTRFLKLYYEKSGKVNTITYFTIVNGKSIAFLMFDGDENITSEMDNELTKIVDSATFDTVLPIFTVSNIPTDFSDKESSVSFTVPSGWGKYEDTDIFSAQFKDNKANNFFYFYDENEKGITVFTEADARDFCELSDYTITAVEHETFNYIDYFKVTQTNDKASRYFTTYLMLYDGKIYEYSFTGIKGSEVTQDITSILSSVRYENIQNIALKHYLGLPVLALKDQIATIVLLSILLTMLIYSLPIIVYRFGVKKAPIPKNKALVITLIYGICFFVITMGLSLLNVLNRIPALTIIIWSISNYLILKSGKAKIIPDYSYVTAGPNSTLYNTPPINPYINTNAHSVFRDTVPDTYTSESTDYPLMCENTNAESISTVRAPEQAAKTNEAQFCRLCGHELAPGSIFCTACGTRV